MNEHEAALAALELARGDDEDGSRFHCLRAEAYRGLGRDREAGLDAAVALALGGESLEELQEDGIETSWLESSAQTALADLSEEEVAKAVAERPALVRVIEPNRLTRDAVDAVLRKDLSLIDAVPSGLVRQDHYLEAVDDGDLELDDIPREHLTEEICRAFVEQPFSSLRKVPKELRTESVCLAAVKRSATQLEHVPEELMEKAQAVAAKAGKKGALDKLLEKRQFFALAIVVGVLKALLGERQVRSSDSRGIIRWLVERPFASLLLNLVLSAFVLAIHLFVTVSVASESGWVTGVLTGICLWFAEIYWGWKEFQTAGVTTLFVACVVVVVTYGVWVPLYAVAMRRLRTVYGHDD